jgi:iron(III) transport system substrate-binding protein
MKIIRSRLAGAAFAGFAAVALALAPLHAAAQDKGPAAGKGPAASVASADAVWKQTVAAANKEGALVIAGPPVRNIRAALTEEFNKAFPAINIEYHGGFPHELDPKILAERQAGRYGWDIYINGAPSALFTLKKEGALDPLIPAMILPEVRDEKKWFGGFAPNVGFADAAAPLTYFQFDGTASAVVYVNRAALGGTQVKTFNDLLHPSLKGRIVLDDPRRQGPGLNALAILAMSQGKEYVQRLLAQQPMITRQPRQIAEWLAQGRYAVGLGVGTGVLSDLKKEGVGKEVEIFSGEHSTAFSMSPGWGGIALINRAPHPNAARVYLNWLLSKEGQEAYVRPLENRNSRRVDVAPMDKDLALKQGVKYVVSQSEAGNPLRLELQALAEKLFP